MPGITIAVKQDRGTVVFVLSSTEGGTPRIQSLVVSDAQSRQHCWLIEPATLGGAIDTERELRKKLRAAGLMVPGDTDRIEDLPMRDPRRQIAIEHLMGVLEASNPAVHSVTYGVLPLGFQLILPEGGAPISLKAGHRYEVCVLGKLSGPGDERTGETSFDAR